MNRSIASIRKLNDCRLPLEHHTIPSKREKKDNNEELRVWVPESTVHKFIPLKLIFSHKRPGGGMFRDVEA